MKIFKRLISVFLTAFILLGTINVSIFVTAATGPVITYHVAPYVCNDYGDGIVANIDGNTIYYSDDFDPGDLGSRLATMDNQNVVYEIHDSLIVNVYTMNEVLYPKTIIKHSVDDGLYYQDGKFSQSSFDLQITIQPRLSEKFADDDLIWLINDTEKQRLYLTLKGLNIKTPYGADFGSSGFAFWKSYQDEVNESYNDRIMYEENKNYSFTINLRNDKILNQADYIMDFSVIPTFDFGISGKAESSIKVANIDYYNEIAKAKKENSTSGKATKDAEQTITLNGDLVTASTTWNNFFNATQSRQLDEFAYVWVSELIMAEIIDYSQFNLKTELEKEIQKRVLSKLGIDSKIITTGSTLTGSANLLTETKDGTEVLVNYVADLSSFKFGLYSSKPFGVTGSLKLSVYRVSDGSQMGLTETVVVNYSDIDTFIDNLQAVAKSTIFNIGKDAYGLSADKTADAITSGLMTKALNSNSKCFSVVSRLTAKQKSVIQKAASKVISDKLKKCNETIFKLATTPSNSAKLHRFECPVNVKVYDNDNNLCASITNNKVDSFYNDVFATVNGEAKEFYTVGDDYWFLVTGYDSGSMKYTVEELNSNGEERKLIYENVPISYGCTYYSLSPEADNMSNVYFDLTDSEGNTISPSFGKDDYDVSYDGEYTLLSGKCGDNAYYDLYDDGLLEINGFGLLYEYPNRLSIPWQEYEDRIKTVIIYQGITNIPSREFELSSLQSITIPTTVTSIGNMAFADCYYLEHIDIPDSVTDLGAYAFDSCHALKSVKISNSITKIEKNTFYGCRSLESITIPDLVISIGESAFSLCDSFQTVAIGKNVEIIDKYAFRYCSSLKNIIMNRKVKSIGQYAFDDCPEVQNLYLSDVESWCNTKLNTHSIPVANHNIYINGELLTDLIIPSTVSNIGAYTFYSCKSLTSVTIPDSVINIEKYAFSDCIELTSISIPNSVTSFGEGAFYGCRNLTSIKIPDSVTSIGAFAFYECTGLTSVTIPDSVINIESFAFGYYLGYNDTTQIYSFTIYGYKNTAAEKYAVKNNLHFVEITLEQPTTEEPSNPVNPDSIKTGTTGDCTWTLDNNGKLTISGNGTMADYEWNTPWGDEIKSVVITNGVTSIGNNAFSYCSNLTSVSIPNSVTRIGESTFSWCESLLNINIPNSVKSIGAEAFKGCSSLASITIPDGIKRIEAGVFDGCESLTSITIPNGVTSIGDYAFISCSSLEGIEIPHSVSTIGNETFSGCSCLESITIPKSVTSIGDYVFDSCRNLESINVDPNNTVYDSRNNCNAIIETETNTLIAGCSSSTIPNGVSSINDTAFIGCYGLKSIIIPSSVTSIGNIAFEGCSGLDNVTISNGVTQIGEWAFEGCSSLKSVTIPSSVSSIGDKAFGYYMDYDDYELYKVDGFTIYGKLGSKAEKYAKDNGFKFVEIGSESPTIVDSGTTGDCTWTLDNEGTLTISGNGKMGLYGYSNNISPWYSCRNEIQKIVFYDGVQNVGDFGFQDCSNLKSVSISNTVVSIGENAFYKCNKLTKVIIPSSVYDIGFAAFAECTNLAEISFSNAITSVGVNAFIDTAWYNNQPDGLVYIGKVLYKNKGNPSNNTAINIRADIVSITGYAFEDCTNIVSITIPDGVTSIGNLVFYGCTSLTSMTLPNSIVDIGATAFGHCTNLSVINLPNRITRIENSMFSGCSKLANVSIPDTVTAIGDYAFYDCTSITHLNIPNGVTTIGSYAFQKCTSLTEIYIPNSVANIGAVAFSGCTNLNRITISNCVTNIENNTFSKCTSLTNITIPNSVICIGAYAFDDCTNLARITIPNSVKIIGSNAFRNTAWYNNQPDGLVYAGNVAYKYKGDMPENTSVYIKDGIKSISDSAFSSCTNLKSITIPDSVNVIGDDAFYNCINLNNVNLGNGLSSIGGNAFYNCDSLESVSIPNSVTNIYWRAFCDCENLKSVTIPNSVTSIDFQAFVGCKNLKEVHISDIAAWCKIQFNDSSSNPLYYAHNLYLNNSLITELFIPETISSIRKHAFYGCTSITNVIIPNTVTSVGFGAFCKCTSLNSITIPSSVMVIEELAFGYDKYSIIENFIIYGKADSAAENYANENNIQFVKIEENLDSVGDVNGDGVVDILDATVIQKYAVEKITLTEDQKEVADVNDDGIVDILDATMIQKFAVEKITEFKKKA